MEYMYLFAALNRNRMHMQGQRPKDDPGARKWSHSENPPVHSTNIPYHNIQVVIILSSDNSCSASRPKTSVDKDVGMELSQQSEEKNFFSDGGKRSIAVLMHPCDAV